MSIQNFKTSVSNDDLEKVIKDNIVTSKIIRQEIIKLKEETETIEVNNSLLENNQINNETTLDDADENIEDESDYYYLNLKQDYDAAYTQESKKEAILNNLPNINNNNYMLIINRIKAEIHREYLELETLKEEDETLEFIQEIEKEQSYLMQAVEIINQSQIVEINAIEKNQTKENKLLFLDTYSGNVYAQQDLLSINEEYYDGFKNLLISIEEGTFKGVKRFKNNDVIKGKAEVRAHRIRVVFDRINKDKYVIIHMFVKKTNNDQGYREKLINRVACYLGKKETILANINDSEYLSKQQDLRNKIIKGLETKNMVKEKKYNE